MALEKGWGNLVRATGIVLGLNAMGCGGGLSSPEKMPIVEIPLAGAGIADSEGEAISPSPEKQACLLGKHETDSGSPAIDNIGHWVLCQLPNIYATDADQSLWLARIGAEDDLKTPVENCAPLKIGKGKVQEIPPSTEHFYQIRCMGFIPYPREGNECHGDFAFYTEAPIKGAQTIRVPYDPQVQPSPYPYDQNRNFIGPWAPYTPGDQSYPTQTHLFEMGREEHSVHFENGPSNCRITFSAPEQPVIVNGFVNKL